MYDVKSILDEQEDLIKKYNSLYSMLRALYSPKASTKLHEQTIIALANQIKRKMAKINEQIYLLNGTLKAQGDL